jgi:hypothetical protein
MHDWLDDLARALAGSVSRREALRRVGGAFVGGLLPFMLPREAVAEGGVRCRGGAEKCSGRCCGAGETCCKPRHGPKQCVAVTESQDGTCGCGVICPSPEDACCNGRCQNISFDRQNCGRCGNACRAGEECCGARGCVRLGTNTDCQFCGDRCFDGDTCMGALGCCSPARVCGNLCCSPSQSCVNGGCFPI